MVKDNNNMNNSSNSLVLGRWLQTIKIDFKITNTYSYTDWARPDLCSLLFFDSIKKCVYVVELSYNHFVNTWRFNWNSRWTLVPALTVLTVRQLHLLTLTVSLHLTRTALQVCSSRWVTRASCSSSSSTSPELNILMSSRVSFSDCSFKISKPVTSEKQSW